MANPLVEQGSLNRLRASVTWPDNPSLNVTASFLGKEGVGLALEGDSVTYLPTLTGAVTSPEPYQMISCTIHLLKTQGLANLYKSQMESDAIIGNGVVRADTKSLGAYDIVNCSIASVRELDFSGADAGFAVTIRGYYRINDTLWNA